MWCRVASGPRLLEGLGLEAHDGCQVALEPDAVADELRQLLVDQALLLLERLPRGCARPAPRAASAPHGPGPACQAHAQRRAGPLTRH